MSDAEKLRSAVKAAEAADTMARMYASAANQKWDAIANVVHKFAHCQEKKDFEEQIRERRARQSQYV